HRHSNRSYRRVRAGNRIICRSLDLIGRVAVPGVGCQATRRCPMVQAAWIIFSRAIGRASRKVCMGALPEHQARTVGAGQTDGNVAQASKVMGYRSRTEPRLTTFVCEQGSNERLSVDPVGLGPAASTRRCN